MSLRPDPADVDAETRRELTEQRGISVLGARTTDRDLKTRSHCDPQLAVLANRVEIARPPLGAAGERQNREHGQTGPGPPRAGAVDES